MNRRSALIGAAMLAAALAFGSLAQAAATFKSDRFSVVVEGKGPDIILVPGLSSSRHVWDGVAAHLRGHYRLHRLQLGGFAGEPTGGNAAGLVSAPVAEDLDAYIKANHLNHPAVIGHSMGGSIAMMLAARHPADVGRVMVVDMPPFLGMFYAGPTATADSVKPMAAQVRQGMTSAPQDAYEKRLTDTIAGMVKTESARPTYVKEGLTSDRDVTGRAMEELISTDLRPELKNITAPMTVLYVWTPAYPFSAEQLDGYYKGIYAQPAGVKLIRIPDSYHFIMVDQPDRLNTEIDTFLK